METDPQSTYCQGRSCSAEIGRALQALAGRWSVRVVEALHFADEPLGFNELRRRLDGVSPKELSRHLALLVDARVVRRAATGGARHAYCLTTHGNALLGPMQALGEWGRRTQPSTCAEAATWLDPVLRRTE